MKLKWGVAPKFPQPDYNQDKQAWRKWYRSYLYEAQCGECGKVHQLKTQKDDSPEYYADIYLQCDQCGTDVLFELPVN